MYIYIYIYIIYSEAIDMKNIQKTELRNYILKNRNTTATNILLKVL